MSVPSEMEMQFPRQTRKENKASFEAFIRGLLLELAGWEMLDFETTNQMIVAVAQHIDIERQTVSCKPTNGRHPTNGHPSTKHPKKK